MKTIPVTGGRVVAANSPPLPLTVTFMVVAMAHLAALHVWLTIHPEVLVSTHLLGGGNLLVAVHLFTLGFGSLLISAAMHQLLPAVLNAPLRSLKLGVAELLTLLLGSDLLIYGFASNHHTSLWVAGVLLGLAVTSIIVHLIASMVRAQQFSATGWFLAAALGHLALVATLGVIMVFAIVRGTVSVHIGRWILAHLTLGLGGWLGLAVVGASYRLVPMFTGSGIAGSIVARPILLTMVVLDPVLATCLLLGAPGWVTGPMAGIIGIALVTYSVDLWRMIRKSNRPNDPSGLFAKVGLVALWLGVAAGIGALVAAAVQGTGQLAMAGPGPLLLVRLIVASVYLLMAGWIAILALGQLHMIIPFLIWMHLYKPLAGKMKIPMLTDLQKGGRIRLVLGLLAGGIGLTVLGTLLGRSLVVGIGSALASIGAIWALVRQLRTLYLGIYSFRTGKNPVGSTRKYAVDPKKEADAR